MRHLIPALVLVVAVFSTANAEPAKTSPFSDKSLGEGGGYKHPDADVGQFFEVKPEKPAELKPERPPLPEKVTPEIQPIAAKPSRPRPRPFAPIPAAAPASDMAEAPAKPIDNAVADRASAPENSRLIAPAGVSGGELDSASEDARRDYETRLFGADSGARRPGLADSTEMALPGRTLSETLPEGMLFVSLELDPQESGTLRDAVAGLGASAAFRPDARFQPLPGAAGAVRISGWIPASRLGDAIARPGVRRVEVERGSRPAADSRVTGDYLLKLRVSDPSRSEESIADSVRGLTARTGFKLNRTLGLETTPSEGTTALVSGTMPVSQLARALALPGVIQVSAEILAQPDAGAAPAVPAKKDGFLRFVMGRSLWLILLTALLALPTIGAAVKKGLSVFVPYR